MGGWFDKPDAEESAAIIYRAAKNSLNNKAYAAAAEKYEELEKSYPFSKYARPATLELAYANYKNGNTEKTVALCDRFITSYPGDAKLDYAYYLKGLAEFNRGKTLLHYIIPRDMSAKSAEPMIKAFDVFSQLYDKFPTSPYRQDVKERLVVLRNMLAVHELRVASFYFEQGSYVATINRIKYMIERYQGAQHTADGLYLMANAYRRIGNEDLARDTLRVLRRNHPEVLDKDLKRIAQVSDKDRKNWFGKLRNMSDVILEKLRIKPRY